jgi:hypothetical protein
VGFVLGQYAFKMPTTNDQHPVEALATDGADEILGESVGPWCLCWGADYANAFGIEVLVEA